MELDSYLQFVFALIFVIGLIILLTAIIRKSGFVPTSALRKGGPRRLKILEFLQVGPKQRLVLIRRDDKDHLILLGANNEVVVETGIPIETPTDDFAQLVEKSGDKEPRP